LLKKFYKDRRDYKCQQEKELTAIKSEDPQKKPQYPLKKGSKGNNQEGFGPLPSRGKEDLWKYLLYY
jgi:hypothetical protein